MAVLLLQLLSESYTNLRRAWNHLNFLIGAQLSYKFPRSIAPLLLFKNIYQRGVETNQYIPLLYSVQLANSYFWGVTQWVREEDSAFFLLLIHVFGIVPDMEVKGSVYNATCIIRNICDESKIPFRSFRMDQFLKSW